MLELINVRRTFISDSRVLVYLIPVEIELHTVPDLKGLISGKNIFGRQEHVGISM